MKTNKLKQLIKTATPGKWELSGCSYTIYASSESSTSVAHNVYTSDADLICWLQNNAMVINEVIEAAEAIHFEYHDAVDLDEMPFYITNIVTAYAKLRGDKE